MLPIIIAQLVVLLKDTALSYIIGYEELLRLVSKLSNFYGERYKLSVFLIVLVIYLATNLVLSWVARIVAARTGPGAGAPRIPKRGRIFRGLARGREAAAKPDPRTTL
jgi:glutamate transport system permease protein